MQDTDNWNLDLAANVVESERENSENQTTYVAQSETTEVESAEKRANIVAQSAVAKTASKLVGKVVAGMVEVGARKIIEAPDKHCPSGYECDPADEDDIETLEVATAEAFRAKFPDANIPWWLGMVLASGNMVIGMRRTRRPRKPSVQLQVEELSNKQPVSNQRNMKYDLPEIPAQVIE